MPEIKTHFVYIHAVPHREHILMGIPVGERCAWGNRITILLVQPVVRTVITIFNFNFQRLISAPFILK